MRHEKYLFLSLTVSSCPVGAAFLLPSKCYAKQEEKPYDICS